MSQDDDVERYVLVPRNTSVGMRMSGHAALDAWKPGIGSEVGFQVMQDIWLAMIKESEAQGLSALPERELLAEALEALDGVIRVADRKTVEFDAARAAADKIRDALTQEKRP
jgi:hypothetical protein